jgi:branched-chain amino acid transport system substrate-binding protein
MLHRLIVLLLLSLCLISTHAQIRIGQTAGYTGIVGPGVKETADGAKLYLDEVNALGGVYGQKIELMAMDDKFDPKLAAENARVLIEEKKVLALFLGRGTPHNEAVLPIINKFGVPNIAPSTGAMIFHEPVMKHVFNVRTPYQDEAAFSIKHLHNLGLTRIAVIHVDDSFGKDGLAGVRKGFAAMGVSALYVDKYDRAKPDFSAIAQHAGREKPQAVIFIGTGATVADGIKALRAAGCYAEILTLSNNAANGFIKQLGDNARGTIVTQVFPDERSMKYPFVRQALASAQAKGISELTPAMLEGYAAANVLVEALTRTGPNPTRAKLQKTLENFRPFDLGGYLIVEFNPTSHTGLKFVDLSIIDFNRKFKR